MGRKAPNKCPASREIMLSLRPRNLQSPPDVEIRGEEINVTDDGQPGEIEIKLTRNQVKELKKIFMR